MTNEFDINEHLRMPLAMRALMASELSLEETTKLKEFVNERAGEVIEKIRERPEDYQLLPLSHLGYGMRELYKRYPPKMGLKYALGMWAIPWIIQRSWFGWKRVDKVKAKIAHQPKSDLALAYALGLEDAGGGVKEDISNDPEEAWRIREIDEEWYNTKGLEVPPLITKPLDELLHEKGIPHKHASFQDFKEGKLD